MIFTRILLLVLFLLVLDASGNVWAFGTKEKSEAGAGPATSEAVWVKRSDFGVSCEKEKAQTLEAGAEELKKSGIQVLESSKGADNKMHIQVCGAPSGSENRYLISKGELEKVKALGFKEIPSDPKH